MRKSVPSDRSIAYDSRVLVPISMPDVFDSSQMRMDVRHHNIFTRGKAYSRLMFEGGRDLWDTSNEPHPLFAFSDGGTCFSIPVETLIDC